MSLTNYSIILMRVCQTLVEKDNAAFAQELAEWDQAAAQGRTVDLVERTALQIKERAQALYGVGLQNISGKK